jgi:hypothetical protein
LLYLIILSGLPAQIVDFPGSGSDGSLPDGLSLKDNNFRGIPEIAGEYHFTVQVSDGNRTASQSYSIQIYVKLVITTDFLPDGQKNESYTETLSTSGGSSQLPMEG